MPEEKSIWSKLGWFIVKTSIVAVITAVITVQVTLHYARKEAAEEVSKPPVAVDFPQPFAARESFIVQNPSSRRYRFTAASFVVMRPTFPDGGYTSIEAPYELTFRHPEHFIAPGVYRRPIDDLVVDSLADAIVDVRLIGPNAGVRRCFGQVTLYYDEGVPLPLSPHWYDVSDP